ncbi:MAG: hypothetical protein ABI856_15465 [Nitrospira sp.]
MTTDDCVNPDAEGVAIQPRPCTYDMDDELDGIIFGSEELAKVPVTQS